MSALASATPSMSARDIDLATPDHTIALASALGRQLDRGLTILLYGELGSGKTAFCQGLACGLDVPTG